MTKGFKPVGPAFQVNSSSTDDQVYPNITALADGGYVIVWSSIMDGGDYGYYGQRYDANSNPLDAEFFISKYQDSTHNFHSSPSVTGLDDGGFIIAYFQTDDFGGSSGVSVQRFLPDGLSTDAQFGFDIYQPGFLPDITTLSNGNVIITWTSGSGLPSGLESYGQLYSSDGQAIGGLLVTTTNHIDMQGQQSVTALKNGAFVITWQTKGNPDQENIFARLYDAAGNPIGSEFQVNSYNPAMQQDSAVIGLAGGGFVVVWTTMDFDNSLGFTGAQIFDSSGNPIGDEFRINGSVSGGLFASISALPDGGFIVVSTLTGYGNDVEVVGQRYDAAGDRAGTGFVIAARIDGELDLNTFSHADITVLSDGGFIITWDGSPFDGDGSGIYAMQFDAQLFGTRSDDILTDTVGANWMRGMRGDDTIYGLDGNDKIWGNRGNDTLYGGEGDDRLSGGKGDDILVGGAGRDVMRGGEGADTFIFIQASDSAASGRADRILDFETGIDTIDLSQIIADEFNFIGDAGFSGTGDAEARYQINAKGNTILRIDLDGDGVIDMKIFLRGGIDFTVDDFIL
ncbi:MAG: M10 family metallopeptidase C-terminal domain-containing protein [Rhodobacteraceae bacterium]|nr:M10 family metallopeptidase C-terminal domain-containing protein [Paracoccaceae bacterium]